MLRLILLRLLSLIALLGCGAALADYFGPAPAFCGYRGGCENVLFSGYGAPLGIPLPILGVAAFAAYFALTLVPTRWAAALVRPLAVLAGLAGATLIAIQIIVIGQICSLCLLVDASGVGLAFVSFLPARNIPAGRLWPIWVAAAAAAVVLPMGLALALEAPTEVPRQVRELSAPGKITLVEVIDFDCQYCRRTAAVVDAFLKEAPGQVHFVRLVAPMPVHRNARAAARAYLGAQAQGKADEMTAALLSADDLSPAECRGIAARAGLDLAAYDRCVADRATDADLDATLAWVEPACPRGLPVIWLQDQMIFGVPSLPDLHGAFLRAQHQLAASTQFP